MSKNISWVVEGIGVCADEIPFDNKKVANLLLEVYSADKAMERSLQKHLVSKLKGIIEKEDYENMNLYQLMDYGMERIAPAAVLMFCDETGSLVWGLDGQGKSYFYYPPSMPWEIDEHTPGSREEVHRRLIEAVKRVTTLSDKQIEILIDDDLFVVGCE